MSGQLLKAQDWEGMAQDANFRPAAMAALRSVSLRQLERHFAKQFHRTPVEWTRDLRIRLAQQLISQGWSNKAVVAELGFTDSAHLCREFRKLLETTPQYHAPVHIPKRHVTSGGDVALLQ
jgi:transcriptional regulator GlxA family with amidase domain